MKKPPLSLSTGTGATLKGALIFAAIDLRCKRFAVPWVSAQGL